MFEFISVFTGGTAGMNKVGQETSSGTSPRPGLKILSVQHLGAGFGLHGPCHWLVRPPGAWKCSDGDAPGCPGAKLLSGARVGSPLMCGIRPCPMAWRCYCVLCQFYKNERKVDKRWIGP